MIPKVQENHDEMQSLAEDFGFAMAGQVHLDIAGVRWLLPSGNWALVPVTIGAHVKVVRSSLTLGEVGPAGRLTGVRSGEEAGGLGDGG